MKVGTAPYGTLLPSFHRSRNTYPPHLTLPYLTYQPTYQPTYSQPASQPANLSHDHFSPLHSLPHYPFPPLVSRFRNQKSGTVGTYLPTSPYVGREVNRSPVVLARACVRAKRKSPAPACVFVGSFVCLSIHPLVEWRAGGRGREEGRKGGREAFMDICTVILYCAFIFFSFIHFWVWIGLDWVGGGICVLGECECGVVWC